MLILKNKQKDQKHILGLILLKFCNSKIDLLNYIIIMKHYLPVEAAEGVVVGIEVGVIINEPSAKL